MLRVAVVLGFAAAACMAGDLFPRDNYFERYGFNKIMTSCFGPYAYKQHIEAIVAAEAQCMGETFTMEHLPQDHGPHAGYGRSLVDDFGNELKLDFGDDLVLDPANAGKSMDESGKSLKPDEDPEKTGKGLGYGVPVGGYGLGHGAHGIVGDHSGYGHGVGLGYGLHGHGLHGVHGLYGVSFIGEGSQLAKSLAELDGAVGNFTCVLKTLGLVGDNLEILYNNVFKSIYKSVYDPYLKQDLLAGIYQCSYELQCLPEDRVGSAYPYKLQRLLAFHKCERKARLTACLKQDIRYHFQAFNGTALPDDNGRTGDVEKILTVLLGAETTEDLRFY